jgi:hypothetical protein
MKASCQMASFCAPCNERWSRKSPDSFGLTQVCPTDDGVVDNGSRWLSPGLCYGFCAEKKNGPPPRSFAADAYDCIMVRVLDPTEYKDVARLICAPEKRAPL